jgi:hypothetical protein
LPCGITTQRLSGFNKMIFNNGNNDQKLLSGNQRCVKIRLKRLVMPAPFLVGNFFV